MWITSWNVKKNQEKMYVDKLWEKCGTCGNVNQKNKITFILKGRCSRIIDKKIWRNQRYISKNRGIMDDTKGINRHKNNI